MTTIRIAHVEPRPGRLADGGFHTRGHLVVLADDAGQRAVPVWMRQAGDLADLVGRPADRAVAGGVPQELATRLLGAAGARVTGVDIEVTEAGATELSPEVTVARIGLAGPSGSRQVTAGLGLGLALAAAADAPVRLADAVLDRLAVPVPGDDLLTPFLDRVPPAAWPAPGPRLPRWPAGARSLRPRYEPRNLDFADGLDRWDLDGDPGFAAAAEGPSATLSATVALPAGSAALMQAVFADDYHGAAVTFSGEIRAAAPAGQAGLRLEVVSDRRPGTDTREEHGLTVAGDRGDWTRYHLTTRIPADAGLIRFGIALRGPGRIALRRPDLRIAEPEAGTR